MADQVVALLTSAPVQTILILLGLVMLFLEINSPGFGIPGVVAIVAIVAVDGAAKRKGPKPKGQILPAAFPATTDFGSA